MQNNKLYIRNNRKDFNSSMHAPLVGVPIVDTDWYQNRRKNDYSTRACAESTQWCTAVMLLFTYNDEHLPFLDYNGDRCMCFNRMHIRTLIRILWRHYKKGDSSPFAYLIGSEYGVDDRYSQRPHYHAIFFLPCWIDPADFRDFCEKIWTGREYYSDDNQSYKWNFGNLGYLFPKKGDLGHDFICKSPEAAGTYCAKYAVKQVGFFNKPVLKSICDDGVKHRYLQCFPTVFLSRKFGACIINDKSTDWIEGTTVLQSNTPHAHKVSIPVAIRDMYYYKRAFRGNYAFSYDPDTHERICRKDGLPKVVKRYERELTTDAISIKLRQLPLWIDKMTKRLSETLHINSDLAYVMSVYHYVYNRLPLSILSTLEDKGIYDFDVRNLCDVRVYSYIYLRSRIFRYATHGLTYSKEIYKTDSDNYNQYFIHSLRGKESVDMLFDTEISGFTALYESFMYRLEQINQRIFFERNTKYRNSQLLKKLVKPHPTH